MTKIITWFKLVLQIVQHPSTRLNLAPYLTNQQMKTEYRIAPLKVFHAQMAYHGVKLAVKIGIRPI